MPWNSRLPISELGFVPRRHVEQTLRKRHLPMDKLIKRKDRILLRRVLNLNSHNQSAHLHSDLHISLPK